jgi:glucarate dehydratase
MAQTHKRHRIADVRVTPIALKDPPLLNASGIHEPYTLRAIIEVELESGITGLGETYGDMPGLSQLKAVAERLRGVSVYDLPLMNQLVGAAVRVAQAQAAGALNSQAPALDLAPGTLPSKAIAKTYAVFEAAMLDAQARVAGIALVELLGGRVRNEVAYSAYLFFRYADHIDKPYAQDAWGEALDAKGIVAQAKTMISQYGFGSIKLKAGTQDPDIEADCLLALRDAFPGMPLRIDPNANWTPATAHRIAKRLGDCLEYYEDPVPTLMDDAALHSATGLKLATNMVVVDWEQFRKNVEVKGIQIILSDHHFWGGLRATQHLAAMCEVFGLGLSMHSNSHAGVSLMTMTHLAASVPNLHYACDTHYPWQCEDVIKGGRVRFNNGCVQVPEAPGIGVELDHTLLAQLHQQYLNCGYLYRDDEAQMRKYQPDYKKIKPRY